MGVPREVSWAVSEMDSYTNRGSSIFNAWVQCLGIFASLNHLTTYFMHKDPSTSVELADIVDMTINQYFDADQMNIRLDIQGNLTSEFNWNTKAVFLYLVAEYETKRNVRNLVTVWDDVITN